GSVGVLLQLPNFHRLLQEKNIDYEMITAGEYKRTLSVFGENTDKGRQKAVEDVQEAHDLFKDFIRQNRPSLKVDEIASGETWFGSRALEKGLVDEISTSDDFIVSACAEADVYAVNYEHKAKVGEKLGSLMESAFDSAFLNWAQRSSKTRFFS
ncbi:MAG: S49 family peptidase, partial [Pseudohongiellaceae bacterium]